MHTITNPRLWLSARRRVDRLAARTEAPALSVPTYVRKRLDPRVQIGILHDPAAPVAIQPAIHRPSDDNRPALLSRDDVVASLAIVGLVLIVFGVI